MDLSFGEKYDTFRQRVRKFIEDNAHLAPTSEDPDQAKAKMWQQTLIEAESGYAARTIPKTYGGTGLEPDMLWVWWWRVRPHYRHCWPSREGSTTRA